MKKIIVALIILFFPVNILAKEQVAFSKCVDGDTAKLKINNKEYIFRFLAVDTPETKHPKKGVEPYGKEASKYTCNSLKTATKIEIEYDDNSTKEDKYGRRLAWIFIDGKLLQKQLISKGYAKVAYLYGNYKYTNDLKKSEINAKNNKLGIWSNDKKEANNNSTVTDMLIDEIFKYVRKVIKNML